MGLDPHRFVGSGPAHPDCYQLQAVIKMINFRKSSRKFKYAVQILKVMTPLTLKKKKKHCKLKKLAMLRL